MLKTQPSLLKIIFGSSGIRTGWQLVFWICMITKENLIHGECELLEGDPEIGSRKRPYQSEKMASKEGMSHNEIEFQKTLFSMSEMVKVLHDDYLEWKRPFQGESSKQDKSEEG